MINGWGDFASRTLRLRDSIVTRKFTILLESNCYFTDHQYDSCIKTKQFSKLFLEDMDTPWIFCAVLQSYIEIDNLRECRHTCIHRLMQCLGYCLVSEQIVWGAGNQVRRMRSMESTTCQPIGLKSFRSTQGHYGGTMFICMQSLCKIPSGSFSLHYLEVSCSHKF